MKRSINFFVALCAFVLIGNGAAAQQMQASAGLELAVPFVNWASFGVGLSGGFEYPVWEQIAATGQLGFEVMLAGSGPDGTSSASNIGMGFFQVGGKYYFQDVQDGFYGQVQLGFHTGSQKFKYNEGTIYESTVKQSVGGASWAIGGGYQMEKFDISARLNGVGGRRSVASSTYTYSYNSLFYFGIRVAYLIPVGS